MKGQLSVEMLVVLVVILGVVALVASVIMGNATKAKLEAEKRANDTIGSCARLAESCLGNSDCCSGNCVSNSCAPPQATAG